MESRIWILAAVLLSSPLLAPAVASAQKEAAVELTAEVLPEAAAGVTSDAGDDAGEPGEEESSEDVAEDVADDGGSDEETPFGERTRQVLTLRSENEVLLEVQRAGRVKRSVISFDQGNIEQVDVGVLEENTTVDIAHLSI